MIACPLRPPALKLGQSCPICIDNGRTLLSDPRVNRNQFLRLTRQWCRRNHWPAPRVEKGRGKGSHVTVWIGSRFTTVKQDGIEKHLKEALLKQLGLPKDAF